MEVLVIGGHGKVALRLLALLSERGHRGRGVIRKPEQAADLEAVGAEAVLCDLEQDDLRPHIGAADVRAQVVLLEVAEDGLGPDGLEVGRLLGLADHAAAAVPAFGEERQEA